MKLYWTHTLVSSYMKERGKGINWKNKSSCSLDPPKIWTVKSRKYLGKEIGFYWPFKEEINS